MQALKQKYTAELSSIQEQQQAAQQALRQRFRRLTGDRAPLGSSNASLGSSSTDLGASGKSTYSEPSTAQPALATPAAVIPPTAQATSPSASAAYNAQPAASYSTAAATQAGAISAPETQYSSGLHSPAAESARSDASQISYSGPSRLSHQPLSASWGTSEPAPIVMDQPQQLPQHAGLGSAAYAPHSEQQSVQEPTQSAFDSGTYTTPSDGHQATGGSYGTASSFAAGPGPIDAAAAEQEVESNNSRLQGLESVIPAELGQNASRGLPDLSKPPRPASSFAGQQAAARTGNVGPQPAGLGMPQEHLGMVSCFTSHGCSLQACCFAA